MRGRRPVRDGGLAVYRASAVAQGLVGPGRAVAAAAGGRRVVRMDSDTTTTAPASATRPRVQLLVKEGCHLCAAAMETVTEVCGRLGEAYELLDGADHPEMLERHAEEIPVLFVDGVQRDFWRVDPVRLERMLTAA